MNRLLRWGVLVLNAWAGWHLLGLLETSVLMENYAKGGNDAVFSYNLDILLAAWQLPLMGMSVGLALAIYLHPLYRSAELVVYTCEIDRLHTIVANLKGQVASADERAHARLAADRDAAMEARLQAIEDQRYAETVRAAADAEIRQMRKERDAASTSEEQARHRSKNAVNAYRRVKRKTATTRKTLDTVLPF